MKGPYAPNLNCQWRIEAPEGHVIRLDFGKLEIEDSKSCNFDQVTIVDSHSQRRICGKREPIKIVSSSNFVEVKFISDQATEYSGFMANYTIVSEERRVF